MRARFDGLSMTWGDRSGVLVGFYIPWMIFNRLWRLAAGRTIKGHPRTKGESLPERQAPPGGMWAVRRPGAKRSVLHPNLRSEAEQPTTAQKPAPASGNPFYATHEIRSLRGCTPAYGGVPPKPEREHAPITEARTSLWQPLLCYPRYVQLTGPHGSICDGSSQNPVFFRVNSCGGLPITGRVSWPIYGIGFGRMCLKCVYRAPECYICKVGTS